MREIFFKALKAKGTGEAAHASISVRQIERCRAQADRKVESAREVWVTNTFNEDPVTQYKSFRAILTGLPEIKSKSGA